MKLNIIDLKKRLELEYNINTKINLYKDYGKYQYLYTINKYTLIIFKYDVLIDRITIEYIVNIENKKMTFLEIKHINEKKNQVMYVVYDEEFMSLLKFSRIGEIQETIIRGRYDNCIFLNERYFIVENNKNNSYYLLDSYTCELNIIEEIEKHGFNISETRILVKQNQEYIVFINSFLDEYDCYIDYKEKKYIEKSGIFYMIFEEFVKHVKNKEEYNLETIIESKESSYIFKVYYDYSKENLKNTKNYHYYIIDYKNNVLYLYDILEKNDKLYSFVLDKIDVSGAGDFYNFFVDGPEINICKLNTRYFKNIYENIYPDKYIVEYYDKENFIKSINGYNIFEFWREDKVSNEYISGVRVKDKTDDDLFIEIIGDGYILDDGSILILDKIMLRTYSFKIENYKEGFIDIIKNLKSNKSEYKWLISDLSLKDDVEVEYKYKFFTYKEIIELIDRINKDIISIRILIFYREFSKDSIIENLDRLEDINEYNHNPQLMHPSSLMEISYNKDEIILITEEKELYDGLRRIYKDSFNLKDYLTIKEAVLSDIDRVLKENNKQRHYKIEIFEKFYNKRLKSLEGYLEEKEVLQYYNKLGGE